MALGPVHDSARAYDHMPVVEDEDGNAALAAQPLDLRAIARAVRPRPELERAPLHLLPLVGVAGPPPRLCRPPPRGGGRRGRAPPRPALPAGGGGAGRTPPRPPPP